MVSRFLVVLIITIFFSTLASAATAQFYLSFEKNDSKSVLSEIIRASGIVFQVISDRPSVCRYSSHKGTSFFNMEGTFDFSFENLHKKDFVGLTDGAYTYFVRCKDDFNNISSELEAVFAVSLPPSVQINLEGGNVIGNGRVKVSVKTSKSLSQTPSLSYSFDGVSYNPIPLFGSGSDWEGFLTISESNVEKIGSFKFQGRDLEGNLGTEITSGGTFFVDTKKPATITNIRAVGYEGEIELRWEIDEELSDVRIYRSTEPGVDNSDYLKSVVGEFFTDTSVDRGRTYYYRVAGVDKAGNVADLSKEVYATALLNNVTVQSGLEFRYRGLVDNFLSEIESIKKMADEIRYGFSQKSSSEKEVFNHLKLDREINGAMSELDVLKREVENHKSQSLTKTELDQKLNSGRLKLNTIKRKIPENLIILSEKKEKRVVGEEEVSSIVLRIWPDISAELKDKRVSSSIKLMKDKKFEVEREGYNVEIVFIDGTRRDVSLIKENIKFEQGQNDSIQIFEVLPNEIARSVSDLSIKNNDYKVIKEDTIISFSADSREIIYSLDKHINLDYLGKVQTLALIELEEEVKSQNLLSGYFSFVSLNQGRDYFGVIFAIVVIAGLGGYLFYLRRDGAINEKLVPLREIIADAEHNLVQGNIEMAKDLYHAASLHYKGLEKKLQRHVYVELEALYSKISKVRG